MAKIVSNPEKQEQIKKAVSIAKVVFDYAKKETAFNQMIERYQLRNAAADYSSDARVARLEEFRKKIEKFENDFKGALDVSTGKSLKSVANWQPLADFFNRTLAHMTEDNFTTEAGVNAARDLKKAKLQKVSKEQTDVIILYHTNKARQTWDKIQEFRTILDKKGLLHKAAAKLPTEAEAAAMAENA